MPAGRFIAAAASKLPAIFLFEYFLFITTAFRLSLRLFILLQCHMRIDALIYLRHADCIVIFTAAGVTPVIRSQLCFLPLLPRADSSHSLLFYLLFLCRRLCRRPIRDDWLVDVSIILFSADDVI